MSLLINVTGQAAGNGAVAIVECLLRTLIAKGVLTQDEVGAVLSEAADMLGQMPQALCKEASAGVRKSSII